MPINQVVNVYSFGFVFNGKTFVWHKKELYRMPYDKNKRSYNKRKLKPQVIGTSVGYWIENGIFKTMKNLEEMTTKINYKEEFYMQDEVPF